MEKRILNETLINKFYRCSENIIKEEEQENPDKVLEYLELAKSLFKSTFDNYKTTIRFNVNPRNIERFDKNKYGRLIIKGKIYIKENVYVDFLFNLDSSGFELVSTLLTERIRNIVINRASFIKSCGIREVVDLLREFRKKVDEWKIKILLVE